MDDGKPSTARVTRREMLATSATAMVVAPLAMPDVSTVVQAATAKFFTAAELDMVDELTDIIIPTDEHSPGAKAAKVAPYIDARLAEAFEDERRARWRAGLKSVDALSTELNGKPFSKASPAERTAVVAKMASGERSPQTEAERFFVTLKAATVDAYYTSQIGIQREMEYKGNTLLQEFVGVDVSK
jgi:hypothetical protein